MPAFDRARTIAYTTKRRPAKVAGRQDAPVPYLVSDSLRCTPLDPADTDMQRRMREQLERAVTILEAYTDDRDIADGDVLSVTGQDYPIRRVERWVWRGTVYLRLLLEEV